MYGYDDKALATVVAGSVADTAQATGKSLAETFASGVDAVMIVDTSGSMGTHDSRGGRARYDVALDELAKLQATQRGRWAVLAFSSETIFVPGGQPPFLGGGTDLAGALRFAQIADGTGVTFFIVSDGEPDDENEALRVAATYQDTIHVIFVGPEDDPRGREFLRKLAAKAGGQTLTADRAQELAAGAQLLLGA